MSHLAIPYPVTSDTTHPTLISQFSAIISDISCFYIYKIRQNEGYRGLAKIGHNKHYILYMDAVYISNVNCANKLTFR